MSSSDAGEVDFIVEKNGKVLPIEVKSGKNYKTYASLNGLLAVSEYGIERAIVVSNANASMHKNGKVRYLPVYYLMFLDHEGLPENATFDVEVPTFEDRHLKKP